MEYFYKILLDVASRLTISQRSGCTGSNPGCAPFYGSSPRRGKHHLGRPGSKTSRPRRRGSGLGCTCQQATQPLLPQVRKAGSVWGGFLRTCVPAALHRRVLGLNVERLALDALELLRRWAGHLLVERGRALEDVQGEVDLGVGWDFQGRHVDSCEGRFRYGGDWSRSRVSLRGSSGRCCWRLPGLGVLSRGSVAMGGSWSIVGLRTGGSAVGEGELLITI